MRKPPEGTGSCSRSILALLSGTQKATSNGSHSLLRACQRRLRHAHGTARVKVLYTCVRSADWRTSSELAGARLSPQLPTTLAARRQRQCQTLIILHHCAAIHGSRTTVLVHNEVKQKSFVSIGCCCMWVGLCDCLRVSTDSPSEYGDWRRSLAEVSKKRR